MSYIPEKINSKPVFFNHVFAIATAISIILLIMTIYQKDFALGVVALSAALGSFTGVTLEAREFTWKTTPFLISTFLLIGRVLWAFA